MMCSTHQNSREINNKLRIQSNQEKENMEDKDEEENDHLQRFVTYPLRTNMINKVTERNEVEVNQIENGVLHQSFNQCLPIRPGYALGKCD